MNLGYLRRHFREAIKEPDPDDSLIDDATANDYLNEGAKLMTSLCQPQESLYQFTTALQNGSTTAFAREYLLPADTDEIFGASIWNGMEQELRQCDPIDALKNNAVCGVPTRFYSRMLTRVQAETTAAGVTFETTEGNKARRFIGLNPKPSGAYVVTVHYYASHFWMRTDEDVPIIPFEFRRGIIKYAEYLFHQSDDMLATANIKLTEFNNFVEACKNKMINRGVEMNFPVVKIRDEFEDMKEQGLYYDVERIP